MLHFLLLLTILLLATTRLAQPQSESNPPPRAWIRGGWQPYLLLFLLAIVPRLLLLWNNPAPRPYVPDEFSHMFLPDTLLQGHLANPTHPHRQHFETLHIFPYANV